VLALQLASAGPATASNSGRPVFEVVVSALAPARLEQPDLGEKDAIQVPVLLCPTTASRPASPHKSLDLKLIKERFSECSAPRTLATRGDIVRITQVFWSANGRCVAPYAIKLQENKRQTVFAAAASKVLGAIFGTASAAGDETDKAAGRVCVTSSDTPLEHTRATLDIGVLAEGGDGTSQLAATQVVTGPEERWFITGDALPTGAKELRWDAASGRLKPLANPQQVYLGANYMFGDLWDRHDAFALRRFTLKFMVAPDRRPLDRVGIGIGYRFADGGVLTTSDAQAGDGGFMIFVGHFWSKSDTTDAAGAPVSSGGRERSWRIGVSYSLDTLLGWINK
jgi:hypothetical protein